MLENSLRRRNKCRFGTKSPLRLLFQLYLRLQLLLTEPLANALIAALRRFKRMQ
jgi:hypothetical protein